MIESSMAALHQAIIAAAEAIDMAAHRIALVVCSAFAVEMDYVEELVHLFRNIAICKREEKLPSPEEPFGPPRRANEPMERDWIPINREPP